MGTKATSVSLKISGDKGPLTVIWAYSSSAENINHALQEIKETLRNISNEEALVGADLNAHNRRWCYATENNIGITIDEFIESNHLHLVNTPDAESTFRHGNSIHLQTYTDTYSDLRLKTAFGGHSRFIKNFRYHVNILYTAIVQDQSKQDLDLVTEELQKLFLILASTHIKSTE
ncbi:hypothetical protein AVEN_78065-1 [Araneus ventricosus]|uniref:Endonuclease/exonuclease/phosphatase domain-containing protein n=1 Tax=Araneus ventricosus TaxID=182803 RepID=A0A4Y2MXW7_ARAVE|nr:hypothetical protein AVEN_78065-1 [Araneus ventricosus]